MAIEIRYHLKYDEAILLINSMKGIRPFEELDLIQFADMINRLQVLIDSHKEKLEREERKNKVLLDLMRLNQPKVKSEPVVMQTPEEIAEFLSNVKPPTGFKE